MAKTKFRPSLNCRLTAVPHSDNRSAAPASHPTVHESRNELGQRGFWEWSSPLCFSKARRGFPLRPASRVPDQAAAFSGGCWCQVRYRAPWGVPATTAAANASSQGAKPTPADLIAAVPKYYLQLYEDDNTKQTIEFIRTIREVQRGVSFQSAKENGGIEQVLEKILVVDRLRDRAHFKYKFTLTPESGLFKLVIKAPKEWPHRDDEGVTFLFSFRDLYLCGYQNKVTRQWHIYKDVILPGIDNPRNYPDLFVMLRFNGGYAGRCDVSMIVIGLAGFLSTYDVIAHSDLCSRREIRMALMRIAACVSEGLRFPQWLKRLLMVLQNGEATTVNGVAGGHDFSSEFRSWSHRSKIIRKGEERFEESESEEEEYDDVSEHSDDAEENIPYDFEDGITVTAYRYGGKEFPTYECYLPIQGVLLSRPPV